LLGRSKPLIERKSSRTLHTFSIRYEEHGTGLSTQYCPMPAIKFSMRPTDRPRPVRRIIRAECVQHRLSKNLGRLP